MVNFFYSNFKKFNEFRWIEWRIVWNDKYMDIKYLQDSGVKYDFLIIYDGFFFSNNKTFSLNKIYLSKNIKQKCLY